MHRLFRVTAALVAMFFVISGLRYAPSAAAAQQDPGVTSDTSYESPSFGYEIEWETGWEVQPDGASSDENGDNLSLFSEDYGTAVTITSVAGQGTTPDAFLDNYQGYLEDTYGDLTPSDFESADPDAPALLVTYEINGTAIDEYAQVIAYDDALVLTSVRTSEGLGIVAAAVVSSEFTFDGGNMLPSFGSTDEPDEDVTPTPEDDETPTPEDDDKGNRPVTRDDDDKTPEAQDDGLEHYTAPTYGVTLGYDADVWDESQNESADDNDGRDLLLLEGVDFPANLYLETYDTYTKASDCFDNALEEAVGDPDAAEPLEDRRGDPIEGSSRGVKYGAFTFEASGGDTQVAYVECQALPEGAGVFVITLITLEDSYDDAYDALSDIVDTVSFEGGEQVETPEPEETREPRETPEPEDTPDTPSNSAGDYESPSYGFSIEYGTDWEAGDETTNNGLDQFVLNGPDAITLLVRSFEAGSRETVQDCVEAEASTVGDVLGVDLQQLTDTDSDEPIAGEDGFGYYALYGYEGESGTRLVYAECGQSTDGDYFVSFIAELPAESLETALDAVPEIINSVKY
jgi:hypothetical protein